jgi:3-(3-hydroxy-phenyl)propionate hydroxylase
LAKDRSGMARIFETPLYPYARVADQDAAGPVHHPVVVVGAGPVGLVAAIDLARRGVPVVVLDENDRVSFGSRAICFSKRTLEILDRLGCGDAAVARGITWQHGRLFRGETEIHAFDLLPEAGHRRPAFINLQQYHLEEILVRRLRDLADAGAPVELRGRNRVAAVGAHHDHVRLEIDTPEGPYSLAADWLVACDGAGSPVRRMLGLDFPGRGFEDCFLIADVAMHSDLPAERRFWFDPPFNPGRSALLHRQPEGIWRIDLQLGPGVDREAETSPDRVIPRIRAMLGPEARFTLDWVSLYSFQCRRMERFRHGRVIFAGDAAHQVSPFGARGANSGIHDADNLGWKLAAVNAGGSEALLESYNWERVLAADENILASSRATDFISPRSAVGRDFRNAVLDLAVRHDFARPMVNSGRLSVPCIYDDGPLNGDDAPELPARTRPGAPASDAALDPAEGGGWLLDRLGDGFALLAIDAAMPADPGLPVVRLSARAAPTLAERWLGAAPGAIYLLRPDRHVAARWTGWDGAAVAAAQARAEAGSQQGGRP